MSGQIHFLKTIQQLIPSHTSLVNELADVLQISNDSAYRRIRGETSLTFDEIATLCHKFHLSFDALNGMSEGDHISFEYQLIQNDPERFRAYFQRILADIMTLRQAGLDEKHVLFAGQGIPIFHYLNYPVLSAFKMFYWMKSIINVDAFEGARFDFDLIDKDLIETGRAIFSHYLHIPSTEIWTDTTVLGTLHQIKFYWKCGVFKDADQALEVCEEVRQLLLTVQKMAELSKKQDHYSNATQYGAFLKLYFSEIEFENNCILVTAGSTQKVYIGQQSFGSLSTENMHYCSATEKWLQNIIKKSNLISGAADSMRYQFFKRSQKQLEQLEAKIKED